MAQTSTVTVSAPETKAKIESPWLESGKGLAVGEAVATIEVVAPVTVTDPEVQPPAEREPPPIAELVALRGTGAAPAGVDQLPEPSR